MAGSAGGVQVGLPVLRARRSAADGGVPAGRALLVAPAYDHGEYRSAESLGLRALAAVLVGLGAEVEVVDECPREPPAEVLAAAGAASLIGVGALFTRQVPDGLALAARLRAVAPSAHLTMGGQGLQFLWEQVLRDGPELDSVCAYEADDTVAELWAAVARDVGNPRKADAGNVIGGAAGGEGLACIRGLFVRCGERVVSTGVRAPVEDLDRLPYPYRPTRPAGVSAHFTTYTSRGCAATCTFCQSGNYGNRYHDLPRWRRRSAESIVDELALLVSEHGATAVSIVDDDFLGGDSRGRERALRFATQMRERALGLRFSIECRVDEVDEEVLGPLRDVGLRHVLVGVESANQADTRLFGKRTGLAAVARAIGVLRQLGLDFSVGFIMFQPLSTPEGIAENLRFLGRHEIGTYDRVTNRLELYPGAPLLRYFQNRGVRLREDRYRVYYDFADPRVAAAYALSRRALRPFAEVERALSRAGFRSVNAAGTSGNPVATRIGDLRREAARRLTDAAHVCLGLAGEGLPAAEAEQRARRHVEPVVAGLMGIAHGVAADVATGAEEEEKAHA